VEIGKRLTAKTAHPPKEKKSAVSGLLKNFKGSLEIKDNITAVKSPASHVLNNVYSITSLLGTSDLVRWFL
jgi:hypothetical protein